jgi:hypothetical protein
MMAVPWQTDRDDPYSRWWNQTPEQPQWTPPADTDQVSFVTPSTTTPNLSPGTTVPFTSDGGDGGDGGYTLPNYPGPSRPTWNFPDLPKFVAPKFIPPTLEDAKNEPGYQFRLKEGEGALQNSAAARGVLNTGGTLKDILAYGQKFASQEYANVFDRKLKVFDTIYQGAKDEYAPLLLEWQTKASAEQRAGELEFAQNWEKWKYSQDWMKDWDQFWANYGKPEPV